MPTYTMKDKGLSTTNGFVFLDCTENELYRADGKNMTLSREYTFKDAQGAELLHLKQKLISMSPTYFISGNDGQSTTLRKAGGKYTIDQPSQERIIVERSLGGKKFTFKRDGKPIANVDRKLVSMAENCTVEIADPKDSEMVLASMVAIYDMK